MMVIYYMNKPMKSRKNKKVHVKCSEFWEDVIEVDSSIFDDIYMEAATRALEKRKTMPGLKVTVTIDCWEPKTNEHFGYNTYFVLINCSMHEKAEMFRKNFMKMYNVDISKESLRGDSSNVGNNIKSTNSGSKQ